MLDFGEISSYDVTRPINNLTSDKETFNQTGKFENVMYCLINL